MKNIIKLSFFVVFILSSFDGSAQFNKRKKSKKTLIILDMKLNVMILVQEEL
jgi:hypothetical protein